MHLEPWKDRIVTIPSLTRFGTSHGTYEPLTGPHEAGLLLSQRLTSLIEQLILNSHEYNR